MSLVLCGVHFQQQNVYVGPISSIFLFCAGSGVILYHALVFTPIVPVHAFRPPQDEAEAMVLMNQQMVYESVGHKIKSDLYEGNAVVLFAYGLSGSGKTFTVFGPDAVDIPEVCRPIPSLRVQRCIRSRRKPFHLSACFCLSRAGLAVLGHFRTQNQHTQRQTAHQHTLAGVSSMLPFVTLPFFSSGWSKGVDDGGIMSICAVTYFVNAKLSTATPKPSRRYLASRWYKGIFSSRDPLVNVCCAYGGVYMVC